MHFLADESCDFAVVRALRQAGFDLGEPCREYVTVTFRRRLHQRAFRERVLSAYRVRCAMCRLRHRELLDAAHIVADRDPAGAPRVSNGLFLCKLHHAAFGQPAQEDLLEFLIEKVGAERLEEVMGEVVVDLAAVGKLTPRP